MRTYDPLGPAELRELVHEADPSPPAARDHYQETFHWWAPWIHEPVSGGREPYTPVDVVPDRQRLARAAQRGSFLIGGDW